MPVINNEINTDLYKSMIYSIFLNKDHSFQVVINQIINNRDLLIYRVIYHKTQINLLKNLKT